MSENSKGAGAAPAVDAAKLTEDEQLALMVKVEGYMGAVDWAGTQMHEKCDAAEAEIFANVNALIAKRTLNALPVDSAELGKLKALAEAANGTEPMGDAWLNLLGATTPSAILRIAALVAQQAARIAELETVSLIPDGWQFLSADFSRQAMLGAHNGNITLVRDEAGRVKWHALPDDERERDDYPLYAYGSGPTIEAALIDARAKVEGK